MYIDLTIKAGTQNIFSQPSIGFCLSNCLLNRECRFDLAEVSVTKHVDTAAVDAEGNPIAYGPFTVAIECTFNGQPVDIEQAERERLFKQKGQLEMELSQAREQALELMRSGNDQPGKAEMLTTVIRQAVELSKQLTHVSERCRAYQGNSITEQDVSEAFQNVEGFWEDLFPVERNRLIRLLVDKVEIRETGIDMELRTNGLTTLIAELAGLACEVTERRASR